MNENNINQSFKLTLEQEFQLKILEESVQKISHGEALSLLIETSRLLMIKDNVIKDLIKSNVFI